MRLGMVEVVEVVVACKVLGKLVEVEVVVA